MVEVDATFSTKIQSQDAITKRKCFTSFVVPSLILDKIKKDI